MRIAVILTTLLLALASSATARNIDLVTLPDRAEVQLTIYNSADLTLVRERREISVKRGANRLQFSWANTLIDPTSVELRPLGHTSEIEVVDTVFPGRKPQHLIWNIESGFEGQVPVEVSYFTSGLTWSMDYVAITDPAEERMRFRGFVRVVNQSGEDYENAQVRLIVGRINLVERIADLARRQGIPVPAPQSPQARVLRARSAKAAFGAAEEAARDDRKEAKKVVKEGVSEYFMFTIEGTETVRHGWSKRLRAVEARSIPFAILYRLRAHQYGPRPVRFFIWRNDAEHSLGDSPLPDGRVRVFRENGREGLSYLGDQLLRYVPVRAPIEVNLGPDDLVSFEMRRASTERLNFSFHRNRVNGWDERQRWVAAIRNDRAKAIRFELRQVWSGDVEFSAEDPTRLHDFQTTEATFDLQPRSRKPYPCNLLLRQGSHRTQERVLMTSSDR